MNRPVVQNIKSIVSSIISISFFLSVLLLCSIPREAKSISDLGPTKELFKVDAIEVIGIKKVEKEAIVERISTKIGMILDNYILRKDIQKIYEMKYFDLVKAYREYRKGQNILVFKVKERPIVTKIEIVGNDELDDDDLKTQIKIKEFSILDINTIKNDVKSLQKYYEEKGYYLSQVDYKLETLSAENVLLKFKIKEFDKIRVKKITFLGNTAFGDATLKGVLRTQEEGFFSFMSESGNFKEFAFQTDIEILKYFYKTKGHLQVNIGNPELTVSEDKRWLFISIKINEGPKFTVNNILFQGDNLISIEELKQKILLKEGDTYSEEKSRKDIEMLTEKYQDLGYAFANVLRNLNIVPGENKVDIEFSFEKGKIAYFGKITVKGNTKTRDKVIRRELKIVEGTKFSGSKLRRSKENVNRLGFFEPGSVVFNTISPQGRNDVLDVEIIVKEGNTGQVTMGAGYSSQSHFFVQASVAEQNFLGYGQNVSFSINFASDQESFKVGFTDPYFLDTKWLAGGDLFHTRNTSRSAFSTKKKGFDIRAGYPIFDFTQLLVTYKFEDTFLFDVEEYQNARIDTDLENGLASSIRTSIIYDKRNNRMMPSKGHYLKLSYEYAGLGGDKKWMRYDLEGKYFKRLYGDFVFRYRLSSSMLSRIDGQRIPGHEKFILGGSRNLRGYSYEAIGPIETVIDNDGREITFNMGGLFKFLTSMEFEHPLAREARLFWVLFFDAGNIFDNYMGENDNYKLYTDYGFGFRWFSPIGVLRFEFGWPIDEDRGDGMQFYFDIGQLF